MLERTTDYENYYREEAVGNKKSSKSPLSGSKMHSSYSIEAKIFSRAFFSKKLELLTHSEAYVMAFQNFTIFQI